jgi:CHAT domain-containing protein
VLSGCRSSDTPDRAYEQIRQEMRHGDLPKALVDVDRASQQFGSKSEEWAWRFRIMKAQILVSQSEFKDALLLLQADLPPQLASTGIAARKAMVEAIARRYAQQFEESKQKFIQAEQLATSFQPQILGEILNNRGALEVDQRKYLQAQDTFLRALALARQQKDQVQEASALGNLGRVATSLEHFDEAIDRNQAALLLSRSLDLKSLQTAILGNMAWSYIRLGDFESALAYYQQAEDSSEKSSLTGYGAYWLTGIADVYYAIHNYDSAEKFAKRALEIARKLEDSETITACLNILSRNTLETGQLDLAQQYNREALKLEESGLDHFGGIQSLLLSARILARTREFKQAEPLFRTVIQDSRTETSLRWEAEARLAKMHDDAGLSRQAELEYLQSIQTIESARRSINRDDLRLTFLSSAIEFYDDYIEFLLHRGRSDEALKVAELSRARTLADGLSSDPKSNSRATPGVVPPQLAQRLHSTLLFYWLGETHSYLWVITPAKTAYFPLPPASEIDGLLKGYKQAIIDSADVLAANDRLTGEKLYATLIAPAQKLIPANSRVILLPDGNLYGLNFETLIAPQPQPHYWIEDVTLTIGSSLTLLSSSTGRPAPKEKNLLLVGNTKEANTDFPPLLQSANEMQRVEQYFSEPHRAVLRAERATPNAYLNSKPGSFAYVHFSTHGTASRTRPLESAVILSKESAGDSYKLYARDIVSRHLNAELVTISACYGSGTRAYSGEGLVGLSWAFLRAGAHNVIGALWEVSDAPATPDLMDFLYRELGKGRDPASALRAAKLSLLHSTTVFRKPFYWAPFQLYAGS